MIALPVQWIAWIASLAAHANAPSAQSEVQPTVETSPVPSSGDAADDAAVWLHPTDPAQSTLICTDKQSGLAVYDLAGKQLQYLAQGETNNVDLRHDFPLGSELVALVTSGEQKENRLAAYVVDPDTRLLRDVVARPIQLGIQVGGCCMYRSPVTGDTYFFGTSKTGQVEQWRLRDAGNGRVDAELVRSFDVGGQGEGCVADDEAEYFYVAQEKVGIWRYGAEPGAGSERVLVDRVGKSGHLEADVEGLAIYYARNGGGYLVASSQGDDTFAVYDRQAPHRYRASFEIGENPALGIDRVTDTDGIDVTNVGLGTAFPEGVLIAQDGSNRDANQNFKLVPWGSIARSTNPPLAIDSARDARRTGWRRRG